jgi:outer membrane protein assembly factor BamA
MKWFRQSIIFFAFLIPLSNAAQRTSWRYDPTDSLKDLTDVINHIFKKDLRKGTFERENQQVQIGVFPAIGYTLQTGFAAVVSANAVIYKKHRSPKDSTSLPSTVAASISYSQYNQVILPLQAVIYFNNNKIILVSDWRYLKYPSYTYGLGMHTSPADQTQMNFEYLKLHQSLLFQVRSNMYLGAGYAFDYFWDVDEDNPHPGRVTDFEKYDSGSSSLASGLSFDFLYDTRDNPINAYRGTYTKVLLIPRFEFMGSYRSWSSLLLEWRGYFRFPESSNNILAFWSYNWFTLTGKPPYLMLPSTAWDKAFNTGRGYIQGRFRSNNMLDAETEYRIQLTRNGLLGMVLFANFESFSDINTWYFPSIAPAGGVGLRLKLNKYSRTNISIDYGWGRQGSQGFFVNLGEAF